MTRPIRYGPKGPVWFVGPDFRFVDYTLCNKVYDCNFVLFVQRLCGKKRERAIQTQIAGNNCSNVRKAALGFDLHEYFLSQSDC